MVPVSMIAVVAPGFEVIHDASPTCLVISATVNLGDVVTVRMRTRGDVEAVAVRYGRDGDPRFLDAVAGPPDAAGWQWWEAPMPVLNERVSYRFLVRASGRGWSVNVTGAHDVEVPDADDFRLTSAPEPPPWVMRALTYEIFPDRFARGASPYDGELPGWAEPAEWDDPVAHGTARGMRQWYGGTLWGIAERLDDLAGLGVRTIYLTPFFPAQSNHRYDATSSTTSTRCSAATRLSPISRPRRRDTACTSSAT